MLHFAQQLLLCVSQRFHRFELVRCTHIRRVNNQKAHHIETMLLRNNAINLWGCNAITRQYCSARTTSDLIHPLPDRKTKWMSAEDALSVVKSGDKIFVHQLAATPTPLLNGLCKHAKSNNLKKLNLYHLLLEGPTPWTEPEYDGIIRSNCFFISGNLRKAVNEGRADTMPIFLSEIPKLLSRKQIQLDVAVIQVSPPDDKGFCTLGTSVDITVAAIQNAKHIIALVNPKVPRTWGDGIIHSSHVNSMVYHDHDLYEAKAQPVDDVTMKIGKLIAENLVEDGATLQTGIGSIPDSVLNLLKGHKDLGIHTEMFADGILPLVECSAVTNAKKKIRPGKVVGSFCLGSRKLYDALHDNPMFVMGDVSWVNDTSIIKQNPKVTAINTCIEIDITGQIVSDSIGSSMFSGVGGQIDFLRGAALCENHDGKPIIALRSTTKKGESKIVPFIKKGAGVVTTRAHAHYVVTEHGIAYLFGKNMRQRARELIKIAHPDHRESLEKAAFERFKSLPNA